MNVPHHNFRGHDFKDPKTLHKIALVFDRSAICESETQAAYDRTVKYFEGSVELAIMTEDEIIGVMKGMMFASGFAVSCPDVPNGFALNMGVFCHLCATHLLETYHEDY